MVKHLFADPGNPAIVDSDAEDSGPSNSTAEAPPEDNYLICDRTGFRIPVDEGLVEEWDGTMVRKESYESRHPQDFVRVRPTGGEGKGPSHLIPGQAGSAEGATLDVTNSGNMVVPVGSFDVTTTCDSSTQITVTWTKPKENLFELNPDGKFVVFRDTNYSGTATYLTEVAGSATRSYTDTGLDTTANTYRYWVLAVDAGNVFRWSSGSVLTITGENGDTVSSNSGFYPHAGGVALDATELHETAGPPNSGDTVTVVTVGDGNYCIPENVLIAVNTASTNPDKLLMKSTDQGATWANLDFTSADLTTSGSTLIDIDYSVDDGRWMFVNNHGELYYSDDSGATWTAGAEIGQTSEYEFCFYSDAAGKWFIGRDDGSNNLYESDDGTSVSLVTSWPGADNSLGMRTHTIAESVSRGIVVIGGIAGVPAEHDSGAYYSEDGGTTWTATDLPDTGTASRRVIEMIRLEDQDLFICAVHNSGGDGDGLLYKSTTGKTWTKISASSLVPMSSSTPDEYHGFAYNEDNGVLLWVSEDDGIYRSTDQGSNWTQVLARTGLNHISTARTTSGISFVAVGDDSTSSNGGLYMSDSSGVTWTAVTQPDDHRYVRIGAGHS